MSEWDLGMGSHRDAEVAESKIIFLVFVDPGGIGSAFNRAGRTKTKIHSH
jgi:hypothetical protein